MKISNILKKNNQLKHTQALQKISETSDQACQYGARKICDFSHSEKR